MTTNNLTFGQELVREFEINDCYGYPEIAKKIDKAMIDMVLENERLRSAIGNLQPLRHA